MNNWDFADDEGFDTTMGPVTAHELAPGSADIKLDDNGTNGQSTEIFTSKDMPGNNGDPGHDKQVKPNKVYIGGLPEHTRQDDLRNCFGKIGNIVNIELKVGFGFVEFDSKEAAHESVAKYHEGHFMGNKIRVELSHSRGRSTKRTDDPGACFRCGESGHWARDCPRSTGHSSRAGPYESSQHNRTHSTRDYPPASYDEFPRNLPPRDGNMHDYLPPRPPGRDYRRALTPPRADRDRPSMPLPPRRDYDDHHVRGAPRHAPAARHDRSGYQAPDRDHPPRGQPPMPPPHRDSYDRYDRRPPLVADEGHPPVSLNAGGPRTPPGLPPRRDDYDRPPRNHGSSQHGRRRPTTPPLPNHHRSGNPNGSRSRRRSLSPQPRYDTMSGEPARFDGGGYSGPPRDGARVRDYKYDDRDFGKRRP